MKENTREYALTDKKLKPLSGGHMMRFDTLEIKPRHSFLEYIFGGCEIGLSIAIDFTLSNRAPSQPDSLHYLDM